MITGIALLLWGVGITFLAFSLQAKIQEAVEPEWQHARDLYDQAPVTFCVFMFLALAVWPLILLYVIYKTHAKGSKTHGN